MKPILQKILLASALFALLVTAVPIQGQAEKRNEEFRYRWQLSNLVGTVAAIFLPHRGEGSLTFTRTNGHLTSELLITSPQSRQGEYFRYGSESQVDTRTLQPIRAWSSYLWRGETKSKSDNIDREGVFDVASGIYAIRKDPPASTRRMEIWSEGKIYPVVVIPLGVETRKLTDGRRVAARHYSIRGVNLPDQRRWKGKLDLWLTNDAAATPVEILISRNLADLRLELLQSTS